MSKVNFVQLFLALCAAAMMTGCASSHDAMAKEYQRLAALEVAPKAFLCGDPKLDDLGNSSFASYNYSVDLMKNYVNATTNHREYIAFMSDVDYYVKEEKMAEKDAMDKVTAAIKDEDQKKEDAEKVWPRVEAGYKATMALDPAKQLTGISPVAIKVAATSKNAGELRNSFKGLDKASLLKAKTCADIIQECATTSECLAFLTLQFQRTMMAKYYMK